MHIENSVSRMKREAQVALLAVVLIAGVTASVLLISNPGPPKDEVIFYVFGDSQGYQGSLEQIAATANQERPDFVFHCGDLTPFGQENQYQAVLEALSMFQVPVHTTPGNHDIREGGGARYVEHLGSPFYSFDVWDAHFTVFNTSAGDVSEEEMEWLEQDLAQSDASLKFVFTHIPPFDPREGYNHTLNNETTAERLMTLFAAEQVETVFAGHIHMYNESWVDGVRYVISGGAGASLSSDAGDGAIYHYVVVKANTTGVTITPVQLSTPSWDRDTVVVRGLLEDVTLSLDDLLELDVIQGMSSFQNQLLNWGGQGVYRGVRISDLIELVGGMNTGDTIRVMSFDGYTQEFCQGNLYPNASWFDLQGDMILAFEFNGTSVPEWTDGMRIAMLPADGAYSNDDCLQTSAPGMGCGIYLSAGARWVRFTSIIEVVAAE
jgi:predicted phosphodiesterase